MTVIATGFDKAATELPKIPGVQAATQASVAHTAPEPVPLQEEDVPKEEEPEVDPFDDIFKIFNKRD